MDIYWYLFYLILEFFRLVFVYCNLIDSSFINDFFEMIFFIWCLLRIYDFNIFIMIFFE